MKPRSRLAKSARPSSVAADDIDTFRAQHLDLVRRVIETEDGPADVLADDSESPLRMLAKRKLVNATQEQAGERLRADFTRAQLTPRVTATWSGTIAQGRRGQSAGTLTDVIVAARQRVRHALDEVGPEHAGVLLDFCCFLKGLEQIERERRWPPRCARIVLQFALDRLARHYGLAGEARGKSRAPMRRWDDSEGGAPAAI